MRLIFGPLSMPLLLSATVTVHNRYKALTSNRLPSHGHAATTTSAVRWLAAAPSAVRWLAAAAPSARPGSWTERFSVQV